ncbi:MAG TPA: UDP-N-acetylmuramyl-tripeptide synthetase [Candidatus Paceibacterota bacterium]
MLEKILRAIERAVPKTVYHFFQPVYHFLLAFLGAVIYRFPSRKLTVVLITGTKGKTSTAEILNNIFEANGTTTALLGTLRFKVGSHSERNMRKMTIPGRFFVQHFLRRAVDAGCTHAIIEMTSEGARQFRERFIDMDALIFTNLAPEHIESHGSYEKYRDAKLAIARTLSRSEKTRRFMIANADDKEGGRFLGIKNVLAIPYHLTDGDPVIADEKHIELTFAGVRMHSTLPGTFNAYNIIAAAICAYKLGVPANVIAAGVARIEQIRGRMERIEMGQAFPVIVDYAHTPDSLEAVYKTFPAHKKICVLGNTGGGRDTWKRPVMGGIADTYCAHVILTNEDPYDEDPRVILEEMRGGFKKQTPEVILDRRLAIARAFSLAKDTKNALVLVTGKGTDPFIMGPNGTKTPWDDALVAREELIKTAGHAT